MSAPLPIHLQRELAALRERAYGRDADLAAGSDDARRLDELEALLQVATGRAGPPAAPAEGAAASSEGGADGAGPAPDTSGRQSGEAAPSGAEDPALTVGTREPWWRRPAVFVASAVALVVGVTVGAVLPMVWSPQPDFVVAVDPDAPVDPTEAWIQQAQRALDVDPGSLRQYDQVEGVTMWTGRSSVGSRCLIVVWGELWGNGGCVPEPADPIVDFRVNDDIPMPLAVTLDEGGVVRFVARGDVVEIWILEPESPGVDAS